MKRKLFFIAILIALLPSHGVQAQVAGSNTKHFEKSGLAFDYPADWKLTDSSTEDVRYINMTPEVGTAQITLVARLISEENCDVQTWSKKSSDALLERIASSNHSPRPVQTWAVKAQVGVAEIEGLQVRGLINRRSITSEVYSFRLNLHLVNLIYLRNEDDPRAQPAWESIRATLKLAVPVFNMASSVRAGVIGNSNVLNSRAVYLAKPDYPLGAKMARVFDTVLVQVIVDELGNVVSAYAISGQALLQPPSVAAAKESKFSPTKLCGEPVRVTGIVTYRFVPM